MQTWFVRRVPAMLTVAGALTLAACADSSGPMASPASALRKASASLRLANATVRVLPGLDGLVPLAINDSDVVVGTNVGDRIPFRWDSIRGYQALPTQNNPLDTAIAASINDHGVIAGKVGTHAAAWLPDGTLRLFQHPADSASAGAANNCGAAGLNIYGVLVGKCATSATGVFAAIFDWHGPARTNVPTNGGGPYTAISNDGWIGGTGDSTVKTAGFGISAYLVSPSGQVTSLDDVFETDQYVSAVTAITLHGWAAGWDPEAEIGGCHFAVAWLSAPGQSHPQFRLGTCGQANGITDDWYIIGTGTDAAGSAQSQQAFVWFPGPGIQRLPGLGAAGETSTAVSINAKHHVLGTITSGGVTHTVIWAVAPRS